MRVSGWFRLLPLALALSPVAHAALMMDGRADEPEWAQAQRFGDFVQIQPLSEQPVPERFATEAMLLSTPEGIAVHIRARQPKGVPRTKSRIARDADGQMDRMNFMVDFDGEGRTGFDFTVTAGGDVVDSVITAENQFNTDWDGVWQHGVHEDDDGYQIEWLIPWTIAPMKNSDAPTRRIGVFFSRIIAATGERWAYPNAIWTRPRYLSDFHRVEIPQYQASSLAVTPYVVASRDIARGDSATKAGVDLFWKPSGDHQFAATIHPDFGQVESDQLVVNFDAIETFYTDKRPFFTENQGYFTLAHPGASLFYTRRVGGPADDGSGAADIAAAAKANGSFGDLGYGVFAASEDGDAGRDFVLLRGTHTSDSLTVGATQTHVERPFLDRVADVQSVDARWRPNDEWSINSALTRSDTDTAGQHRSGLVGGVIVDWDMPGPWRQQYFLIHADDDVEINDLGFQERNDFLYAEWETGYRQDQLPPESKYASHQYEFELKRSANGDGRALTESVAFQRRSEVRDGGQEFVLLTLLRPAWDDRISRGNGIVRRQGGWSLMAERNIPRHGDSRWDWYFYAEATPSLLSGYLLYVGAQPKLHVGDRFDIDLGLFGVQQSDWVLWQGGTDFASFDARRAELYSNLNWFIDERQELRVKLQAIAIDAEAKTARTLVSNGQLPVVARPVSDFGVRNLGFQVRYRYKLGNLSDVFAVYSRGGFEREDRIGTDLGLGSLFGDTFGLKQDHQFLLKVAYRFEP